MATREELVDSAKIAASTGNEARMRDTVQILLSTYKDLTSEECDLLQQAYLLSIDYFDVQIKQYGKQFAHVSLIPYNDEQKILKLMDKYFELGNEYINLVQTRARPDNSLDFNKVFLLESESTFFFKMARRCHLNRHGNAQEYRSAAGEALKAAVDLASTTLAPSNPTRMSVMYGWSLYNFKVLKDPVKACDIAVDAYNDAGYDALGSYQPPNFYQEFNKLEKYISMLNGETSEYF